MFPDKASRQGNQRQEEQEQQVHPHQLQRGPPYYSEQLVMIDPKSTDDDKTKCVDAELRRQRRQETVPVIARGRALRQLQFKDHDGDDDGDDAVTERSNSLGAQAGKAYITAP